MSEIQVFPPQIWILYLVSLACCCIGFFRFVWFMSVGYGLSTAGIGADGSILFLRCNAFCSFFTGSVSAVFCSFAS